MRRGLCEPSISINRLNPDTLVAAAILDRVFYSFDGGKTWTGDSIQSTYGVWGDPVVISDYQGSHIITFIFLIPAVETGKVRRSWIALYARDQMTAGNME